MSPSLDVVSSATRLDFGLNPRGAGSILGLITLLGGSGSGSAAVWINDKFLNLIIQGSL